jgi:hypothetical protein
MPKRTAKLKIPGAKPKAKPPKLCPSDGYLQATRTYCRIQSYPAPESEHRFHPVRQWRFDLAWPDRLVAVEVDGGVFSGGRHVRGVGRVKDMEKLNHATALGWRVYVVTPGQLRNGTLWQWLNHEFGAGLVPVGG